MAEQNHIFSKMLGPTAGEIEAQQKLERERRDAEARAYHAEAYRQMPEDLRTRAKEWNVSALMEAVWLNGWDCGYRQSVRDGGDHG